MLSGAGFDEACGDGNECTGTNIECSSSKCACTSASFRNKANDQCIPSRYHNRITKIEWVNESSLNIHLQRPKYCSTPVLLS